MTEVKTVKTWREKLRERQINLTPEYLEKSLRAKVESGEIPEEFFELFAQWLDTMERLANVGGPVGLDPIITFLVLSKEDRYAFLGYYLQEQIDGFGRLIVELQYQKKRLKGIENGIT